MKPTFCVIENPAWRKERGVGEIYRGLAKLSLACFTQRAQHARHTSNFAEIDQR